MNNGNRVSLKLSTFLLAILILGGIGTPIDVSAGTNVESIYHEPENITSEDKVTVYLTVKSTDNITQIQYDYCQLDPLGICTIYKNMTHLGGRRYSAVIPKQDGGTKIGYNVSIEYDNGSKEYTAPNNDTYHIYWVEKDEGDNDSPFPGIQILLLSIFISIVLFHYKTKFGEINKLQKKNQNRDGPLILTNKRIGSCQTSKVPCQVIH